MDISEIVNWGTFLLWVLSLVVYIAKLLRGEAEVHPWLKWALSSNVFIGIVIAVALLFQGASLYINYHEKHLGTLDDVTITGYPPDAGTQTLQVVKDQTFEDQNIALDGHLFDHCTFINVCLLYDGGAYQIQHSTLKKQWSICTKNQSLNNYTELARALVLFKPAAKHKSKSVLRDFK